MSKTGERASLMGKQGITSKVMSKQCSKRKCEWEDISGEQGGIRRSEM